MCSSDLSHLDGVLEAQIDAVIQNSVEMGSAWADVVAKVSQDSKYQAAFAAAYPDAVTQANIQNAIATFERTLITPNSRFDQYLGGDSNAISADEKAGYLKFKQYGCALAAMEMEGSLTAHSDGPGKGTIFALEVPLKSPGGGL